MAKRWPELGWCQSLNLNASASSPWCVLYNPLWQESSHFHQWPWHPPPHPLCLQRPRGTSPAGLRSRGWTRHRCSRPCSCSAGQPCVAGEACSARRLSVQERWSRLAVLGAGAHPGRRHRYWGAWARSHTHLVPQFPRCPLRMVMGYHLSYLAGDQEHLARLWAPWGQGFVVLFVVVHYFILSSNYNAAWHIITDQWMVIEWRHTSLILS